MLKRNYNIYVYFIYLQLLFNVGLQGIVLINTNLDQPTQMQSNKSK